MLYKILRIILLALIPLLFLFICVAIIINQPPSYAVISDPTYVYLLNGLNFAQGKFISGSYIHPGMPLQLICGIVIKLTHLFAGQDPDIVTDVFSRPEFYILMINISLTGILAALIFFMGWFTLMITGNIIISFLMQSVVFTNQTMLYQLNIIGAERFVVPFILILITLLIWYIYDNSKHRLIYIFIGIAIAFCCMQKLTMLPLAFMPLFMLKTKKDWFQYVISLCVTAFILSVPIMSHYSRMFEFFTHAAQHSGLYGEGKSQFIDLAAVRPNLSTLFGFMKLPVISLIVLILFIPISWLKKSRQPESVNRIRRIMIGMAGSELLILLMIIKHFKAHYYAPVAAFSFFNLFLCLEYLRIQLFLKNRKLFNLLLASLCLISLVGFGNVKRLLAESNKAKKLEKTLHQLEICCHNSPVIIIPRYYGSPFVEFSIMSGYYWSYNRNQYGTKLKEMYPDSYLYTAEWGIFNMAYVHQKTKDVLLLYDKFILSYYYEDTLAVNSFFRELNEQNRRYSCKRTFFNHDQGYAIDEIKFFPDSVRRKQVPAVIPDMEKNDTLTHDQTCSIITKSGKYFLKFQNPGEI